VASEFRARGLEERERDWEREREGDLNKSGLAQESRRH
jgi:hypothetical protein